MHANWVSYIRTGIISHRAMHGGMQYPLPPPYIGILIALYLLRLFHCISIYAIISCISIIVCRIQVCGRPPGNLRKSLQFGEYKSTPFPPLFFYNVCLLMATFQVGFKRVNGH